MIYLFLLCVVWAIIIFLFASPEERFSREKNSRKFPHLSLDYYLKKNKIKIEQIDYFVSSLNPGVYFNKFNPIISNQRRHFSEHLISLPDNVLAYKNDRQFLTSNLASQILNLVNLI